MIEQLVPTLWPLKCPECGESASVELTVDAEPGAGIERCRAGHDFMFAFDGLSVRLLGEKPVPTGPVPRD